MLNFRFHLLKKRLQPLCLTGVKAFLTIIFNFFNCPFRASFSLILSRHKECHRIFNKVPGTRIDSAFFGIVRDCSLTLFYVTLHVVSQQISFSYFDLMSIPVITPSVQRDHRAGAHHRHVVPFCVTGNSLLRQKKDPTWSLIWNPRMMLQIN